MSAVPAAPGADYDLDGAAGVGSAGAIFLARQLLQGDQVRCALGFWLLVAADLSWAASGQHCGRAAFVLWTPAQDGAT